MKEALCRGNLIFKTTTKTLFRFKFHPRSTGKCRSVISAWGRRGAAWLNMSPFSPSELLEAPSDAAELEAVRKAKILYRSCMNESEFQPALAERLQSPHVDSNSTPPDHSSCPGEVGLQADAEDAETARVPLARCGRRAQGRVPVVGEPVEPSEDAGGHQEPPQQERPGSPVRVPGRQKLLPLRHQGQASSSAVTCVAPVFCVVATATLPQQAHPLCLPAAGPGVPVSALQGGLHHQQLLRPGGECLLCLSAH